MVEENHLSFDPWPKGRKIQVTFQTRNEDLGLLQVRKVKDHSECTFSLNIDLSIFSTTPDGLDFTWLWTISLAHNGLTLIIGTSCYSWNHDTAQFDRINYSPDGKFFACCSYEDRTMTSESRTHKLAEHKHDVDWRWDKVGILSWLSYNSYN